MRRTPIAHVVFPSPNPVRPVSEFAWDAARLLSKSRGLDVEILVPVPIAATAKLHRMGRRLRNSLPWDDEAREALVALEPKPTLIPFVPLPWRSIESATAAIAAHLIARPRAGRPSLLHGSFLDSGGYAAAMAARAVGCASISVAHGTDVRQARCNPSCDSGRHRRALAALQHSTEVVACCDHLTQEIARLGRTASVIRYTAEPESFPMAPMPSGPPRLLFVGRLSKDKGVDLLLDAIALLGHRELSVDLVGPAVPGFDVAREVERLRLSDRVTIFGELPRDQLASFYARSSALVMPSRAEGLSCVLVESLLVGRPVVATDVGGQSELVDDRVGALVAPDDARALAAGIDSVLERLDDGQWDARALHARALPFSWQHMQEELERLTWRLVEDAG